jgi:uncharacterized protein YdbL (DUF1318 family)
VTPAVVVVVPARDEEHGIASTLASVRRSLSHARQHGVVGEVALEVVAHRCRDATAAAAARAVGDLRHAHIAQDESSTSVGQVRDSAARRGLARLRRRSDETWLLSTDADTRVYPTWVADLLATAARDHTVGVVGLADLDHWEGDVAAQLDYDALLAAKMHPGESGLHRHDHVYGANLGVRFDAYLDVGGFPDVPVGEDQHLVDRLVARGHRLSRTTSVRVLTSGRLRGRAPGGLADHLAMLAAPLRSLTSAARSG